VVIRGAHDDDAVVNAAVASWRESGYEALPIDAGECGFAAAANDGVRRARAEDFRFAVVTSCATRPDAVAKPSECAAMVAARLSASTDAEGGAASAVCQPVGDRYGRPDAWLPGVWIRTAAAVSDLRGEYDGWMDERYRTPLAALGLCVERWSCVSTTPLVAQRHGMKIACGYAADDVEADVRLLVRSAFASTQATGEAAVRLWRSIDHSMQQLERWLYGGGGAASLASVAIDEIVASGVRSLLCFGAGSVFRLLAERTQALLAELGVRVVGVVDDDARLLGMRIGGVPVLNGDEAASCGADGVLITSLRGRARLRDVAASACGAGPMWSVLNGPPGPRFAIGRINPGSMRAAA
jgi:hypothetical protein